MLIHLFGMKAALLVIVRQKYKRFVLAVIGVRTDSSSCSNCSELLPFASPTDTHR